MKKIILISLFQVFWVTVMSQLRGDDLPPFDKPWGPAEYSWVLDALRDEFSSHGRLPTMKSADDVELLYRKLFSFENLGVFLDSSLSRAERFSFMLPFWELLPSYLELFEESSLKNEACLMLIFMLEMTKQVTILTQVMIQELPEHRALELKRKMSDPMSKVLSGMFEYLTRETKDVDIQHRVAGVDWLEKNLDELWVWLDGKQRNNLKKMLKKSAKITREKELKTPIQRILKTI